MARKGIIATMENQRINVATKSPWIAAQAIRYAAKEGFLKWVRKSLINNGTINMEFHATKNHAGLI